ncbi:PTS IIA-like nitrogen regulatory protein PtsN [Stakelama sediminis]|uniref:PTS system nitrogen regulatory IIA component n=1 Tax=Stakelama sediminis TaxID=463200 RepID=A0A840Z2B3_9SPHN|nr:PTS system nitrogen regulatory IIA component [Stakelama sediminis]
MFTRLGQLADECWSLDAKKVSDLLHEREKLVTTGSGNGIAIPHARYTGLPHLVGAVLVLEKPIDFDAIDDMPVDLIFMLLTPPDAGSVHLKMLARVARALRDQDYADKLRGAGSDDALFAILTGLEARDAA